MVATLVSLRWRSTLNLLRREPWRLVVLIASLVWVVAMLPGTIWGIVALIGTEPENRAVALTVLAAMFAIGWALVPIMLAAGEDVLEPARFAPMGVSARAVMPGLVVAALVTGPALITAVLWILLTATWFAEGPAVGALGVVGGIVQVVSFVALAKVTTAWTARLFATRRHRIGALIGAAVVVVGGAYLAWLALRRGLESLFENNAEAFLAAVASTPIASAVNAPMFAEDGEPFAAAWRLGAAIVWTLALILAWRSQVTLALVTPAYRSAGGAARRDGILRAGRVPVLRSADRTGPAGAVYGRLARAWRGDPRYLAGLIPVVIVPAIFVIVVVPSAGLDPRWSFIAPVLLAASIGWGRHNDVALDSTALWLDVVAGSRGVDVVRGRNAAVVAWALPVVVLATVGVAGWSGHWAMVPALLGAGVGALGLTLAVSAMTSVLMPYRTPAPGENPFSAEAGSLGAGLVAQLASSAATIVLLPLVIVPCVLAVVVDPAWGVVSAIAGVALGVLGYHYGLIIAGRLYDVRSGRLVAAVG